MKTSATRRTLAGMLAGVAVAVLGVVAAPSALAASNDEIAFDYFVSKGLTERQSAGIVGNLVQESGSPINPYADQPGGPGMGIASGARVGAGTPTPATTWSGTPASAAATATRSRLSSTSRGTSCRRSRRTVSQTSGRRRR